MLFGALLDWHFVVFVSPRTTVFAKEKRQTATVVGGATGRWLNVRTILSLQSALPVAGVGDEKLQREAPLDSETAVAARPTCTGAYAASAVHAVADLLTIL